MKALSRVGGSIALLYLVCILFFVGAVGYGPSVIVPQAHADASEKLTKAAENIPVVVEQVVKAKAEPVSEQSVVAETAGAIPDWAELLGCFFAIFSAVAAVTPTPKDNAALIVLRKAVDLFGFNFWGAKNSATEKAKLKSNRLL